ncbi:hypothetical protein [Snuella sedimenti]|uniref:NlpE C-terminal OB domain-containing protein n=1 Tax=Snuella sedimenti TaxID=2798802 RepID=A0A8J7JAR3_9FLAO|nr:hypothetical protein [Snuella sedimenti]MBJ6367594.1 hypothetical protein [Snuella sedimenti]
MRRALILLVCLIAFASCKKDNKKSASGEHLEAIAKNDDLTLIKGEFIYYADAAVLQTNTDIYGVVIDTKMHELNEQVKKYKVADTDMVPVEIRGKIIPKPEKEEGWPFRIEIKEILNVSRPNPKDNNVIKLGNE